MSNLENLTGKILEEARAKAQGILNEAQAYKAEVVGKKVQEAEERKAKILEKAAFDANLMKERIVSNAEVVARNAELSGKQKVIDQVFAAAKEQLADLPQEKYLAFLQETLNQLPLKGSEVLVVPASRRAAVEALGLKLSVSAEETVESGFLIKDDKVSLNYNFSDLVDFHRDELVKDVASSLFQK
ncbi:V-type ATP synthase subunit E [Proteiniclasticum sp. BAD-10]|uniref:V-type proton ATPase subunit E n=1 Tax=Proteiniclasticum sediminis TaxID=2804028 RepID=A0A941CNA4_9CLOT|nr:V-type ATP synthase subunit E [Proteiniclasticum sediminis]MBR0575825.1 V-type ATP synthase subunit E [Proteiniclasticum sediminis]